MPSPTVIRHTQEGNYIIQVVTYTDAVNGWSSSLQIYSTTLEGKTTLEGETIWSDEKATDLFQDAITQIKFMVMMGFVDIGMIIIALNKSAVES